MLWTIFSTLLFPASSIYLIPFPVTESNWKEEKSSLSVLSWRAVLSLSLNSLQLGCQSLLISPKNFILAQSLWKAPVNGQWWEEEEAVPAALRDCVCHPEDIWGNVCDAGLNFSNSINWSKGSFLSPRWIIGVFWCLNSV